MGRITDVLASGAVFDSLGVPAISSEVDRGTICGSMDMLCDTKAASLSFDLTEGANNRPDTFSAERAFVD